MDVNRWLILVSIIAFCFALYQAANAQELTQNSVDVNWEVTAGSALVIEKNTGDVVFEKDAEKVRSIASLTKLMTALVFLENNPGWGKAVVLEKSDFVGGATLWLKKGDKVKVKDLFYAMLVGSKNNATMALVRASGLSKEKFVETMNIKARNWNLKDTIFYEPTGLDEENVSTAEEMAKIARAAFGQMDILKATTVKEYKVKAINRRAAVIVKNTSGKILKRDLYITGSKTGWTDEAGYNLVTQAKTADRELLALVLGGKKMAKDYEDVYQLLKKYLFQNKMAGIAR
ncbi:D-alanyl-D-alanine carboxypeptidase [Candidatus Falkowbacteria bacterium]|nr:D-alanyl-D-alanine carboxypeptidase [Candidatus Falkowbacteria bacterium]